MLVDCAYVGNEDLTIMLVWLPHLLFCSLLADRCVSASGSMDVRRAASQVDVAVSAEAKSGSSQPAGTIQ